MEQVFTNKGHGTVIMKSLTKLWKDKKYCDAVIEIGTETLEFHKLILVASSPSFLSTHQCTGKLYFKISGDKSDVDAAKTCLTYLYEGIVELTETNLDRVTEMAKTFELKELIMLCTGFQDLLKKTKNTVPADRVVSYELVIETENTKNRGQSCSKDTPDSTGEFKTEVHFDTQIPLQVSCETNYSVGQEDNLSSDEHDANMEFEAETDGLDIGSTDKSQMKKVLPSRSKVNTQRKSARKKEEACRLNSERKMERHIEQNIECVTDAVHEDKTEEEMKHFKVKEQPLLKHDDNLFNMEVKGELSDVDCEGAEVEVDRAEDLAERIKTSGGSPFSYLFQCPVCQTRFRNRNNFVRHLNSHKDNTISCPMCLQKFDTSSELKIHKKNHHRTVLCNMCGAAFLTTSHVNQHMCVVHGVGKKFCCKVEGCGRRFSRQSFLQTHMNMHSGSRPYKCAKCEKGYVDQYSRRRHEITCGSQTRFECDVCQESFKSRSTLDDHKQTKHLKKIYMCSCGKTFTWRSGLSRHKGRCGTPITDILTF